MVDKTLVMTRVAIGNGIGFVIGLIGLIVLPYFIADVSWLLRWGILFWYVTVGAIIGVFGVVTWHPILKLPMPWWFRATLVGAWMNFVLTFFAYDELQAAMIQIAGNADVFGSPFWFTLEGAIVGYVMGFIANRLGREGPIRIKG
jgi:hypothetical protein